VQQNRNASDQEAESEHIAKRAQWVAAEGIVSFVMLKKAQSFDQGQREVFRDKEEPRAGRGD
jgi:hypothetical protein